MQKRGLHKIQVSTRRLIFFQAFFLQLRKLQLTCEDHSFTWFLSAGQMNFISLEITYKC